MLEKIESTHTARRLWRFVQFPLTRMLLAGLFLIIGVMAAQLVIGLFGTAVTTPTISVLSILIAVLATYFSYRFYVQWIEKRPVTELLADEAVKEFTIGLLIGFGIVATIIGTLWVLGSYQILGFSTWLVLLSAAVADIPSGFVQEILFRGILFRITEESLGTWIAMIISAVLFGLIHILSANATLFSTVSIMLQAGILLAAAYTLTKRLWLAIGLHIAWDFAIDGVFGVGTAALSGKPMQGLLQGRLVGHEILTGGTQGVETSIVAVMVALLAGCLLTWLAWHNGNFTASRRLFNRKL